MEPFDTPKRSATRFAGLADLWDAVRNFGLLGSAGSGDDGLVYVSADDGYAIPVRALGHGTPVLLVHGLGCSYQHWMPVARRLAHQHRVLAWDARGHGLSRPGPGTSTTLARLARDVAVMLDHFALDRAVLVGHSMGALTVMQYLHDHGTARVAAVALVDQSPRIVTDDQWRLGLFGGCSAALLGGLIAGARQDLAQTLVREVEAVAGDWLARRLAANAPLGRLLRHWLERVDVSSLLDLAESLAGADLRGAMARLDAPLLVVLGARSPHYAGVPLDAWYRRTVPHASVSVYEKSGHSPHCTEPERFARQLMQFIADHA